MDLYELLRGPGLWIALVTCLGGTAARLILLVSGAKKIRRLHPAKSFSGGIKSVGRGLIPFGLNYMREHPWFVLATFVFHVCVLVTPLFLLAHIVLVYESWRIQWMSLPDGLADVMTLVVVAGALFFAARRLSVTEIRRLSSTGDWALLLLIAGVFLTGMMAYHHWGPYRTMLITHILMGELLLVLVPFSKLVHMILFFFTRGYLGAEYEIVLDGQYL